MAEAQDGRLNQRPGRRALAAAASLALAGGALLALAVPALAAGPSVSVNPSSGLKDGQSVTVTGSGFTPDFAQMVVVQCAATATGAAGCNVNDVKFTKADGDGGFTVTLTVASKFGSTDCAKVECIVQAHEGISSSTGKTGTSAALKFGAPNPTHSATTAPPSTNQSGSHSASHAPASHAPASHAPASHAAAQPPADSAPASPGAGAGVAGVQAAAPSDVPTAANSGMGVPASSPWLAELAAAAALLLLLTGLGLYRRRAGSRR